MVKVLIVWFFFFFFWFYLIIIIIFQSRRLSYVSKINVNLID
jgi:hypothetical protein